MNTNQIIDNNIVLYVSQEIYSKEAIIKCLYWYSNSFSTKIDIEENYFKIVLRKNDNSTTDLSDIMNKIERDLLDFNLRDIVSRETKTIRELIIAKAFSYDPN